MRHGSEIVRQAYAEAMATASWNYDVALYLESPDAKFWEIPGRRTAIRRSYPPTGARPGHEVCIVTSNGRVLAQIDPLQNTRRQLAL